MATRKHEAADTTGRNPRATQSDSPAVEAGGRASGADEKGKMAEIEMRSVPVEFVLPDDLRSQYADAFNVFFTDYDFTLSFLQSQSPLIFKDEDWEAVEKVKAITVSRIVIPPHLIPRLVNMLTENWNRFMEIRNKQRQELKNVNVVNGEADASAKGNLQP